MSEQKHRQYPPTLCWDCAKATGKCNWSRDLKPVKGWNIVKTRRMIGGTTPYTSCIVKECPEFERDAYDAGMKRIKKVGEEE